MSATRTSATRAATTRAVVARAARRSHGIVTRTELLELGVSPSASDRLVAAGHLERLFPGVYRAAGAPDTWEGRALAAQRRVERQMRRMREPDDPAPIAALAGRAAAYLHGLPGQGRPTTLEIATSHRVRSADVRTRRLHQLGAAAVVEVRNIPVLSIPWTAVTAAEDSLPELLAAIVGRGLSGPAQLLGAAHRADRPRAIEIVRSFDGLPSHVRSATEARVAAACGTAGLPMPRCNHPVRVGPGAARYLLDLAWPDLLLDVEIDGPHHLEPTQRRRDRRRDRELRDDGWKVVRFTVEEVDECLEDVIAQIGAKIEELRGGSRPSVVEG